MQGTEDAMAAGIDVADFVPVFPGRFDDAGGGSIDDRGHPAGLGIKGIWDAVHFVRGSVNSVTCRYCRNQPLPDLSFVGVPMRESQAVPGLGITATSHNPVVPAAGRWRMNRRIAWKITKRVHSGRADSRFGTDCSGSKGHSGRDWGPGLFWCRNGRLRRR